MKTNPTIETLDNQVQEIDRLAEGLRAYVRKENDVRDIKFRQWISKYKQMQYGAGIVKDGHWQGFSSVTFSEDPIMQFTGLLDKNGKGIYEGDVVKVENITGYVQVAELRCTVIYKPPCYVLQLNYVDKWEYYFVEKPEINCYLRLDSMKTYEVIGNVHENPELLAEDK